MRREILEGRVAIVTGGGRGLGAAVSELFARQGCKVAIVARSGDEVEALAARLRAEGREAIAVRADVSKLDECREVVERTTQEFGPPDLLVNNAAVAHPFQRIEEVDPVAWADAVQVNLLGCFYMTRFVLPQMLAARGGTIIHVSSGLAYMARIGQSAYCVSKAGLEMLREALALETAGTGVIVTSYDPGMIDTPMQAEQRVLDAAALRIDTELFHKAHREGRLRDPAYVAQGILWLALQRGEERNGQRFNINEEEWRARMESDLSNA